MSSIQYVPQGENGFRCTVVARHKNDAFHIELFVSDAEGQTPPQFSGDKDFLNNEALIGNMLNFGASEYSFRKSEEPDQRATFKKSSKIHAASARALADFIKLGSYRQRNGWCSSCFKSADHFEVDGKLVPQVFICQDCGDLTTPCMAPGCRNMARRSHTTLSLRRYCAEHTHEIRSFSRMQETYESLEDVSDLRDFEKKDLARLTKTVIGAGAGLVVVAPLAFLAAPAIGGALGASGLIGPALSGAAASSHGLAVLGGGAVAYGGLGMVGGTMVVAATGAALGSAMGAVTTTAYVADDKSFEILKVKEGTGTPVLFASGFLSEDKDSWDSWKRIISERYPNNPVFHVRWGAKELKDLPLSAADAGARALSGWGLKTLAKKAHKKLTKIIPGISAISVAAELLANPWHVAKNRADQTAAILADVLTRVNSDSFILAGHSLGGRVMIRTAELMHDSGKLEAVHVLGAAIGAKGNWNHLNDSVTDGVYNYFSKNDSTLKYLYQFAQAGQKPAGLHGFSSSFKNINDVEVTERVMTHLDYIGAVDLC